jgi:hypothetical protein
MPHVGKMIRIAHDRRSLALFFHMGRQDWLLACGRRRPWGALGCDAVG